MMKIPGLPAVNSDGVASECGNCGLEERYLLHHVNHRASFRRLCSRCVLHLHPQSFCPTCFEVYPPPPPNDSVFTCVKCYSNSHYRCVAEGKTPPPKPYICPLCVTPNLPIFKLETSKGTGVERGEDINPKNEEWRILTADAAKKLLAAGKIASTSMNKVVAAARVEAERRAKEAAYARKRAKEAAYARKRAKEALEHLANFVKNKKLRKKESSAAISGTCVVNLQCVKPETNGIQNGVNSSCMDMESKIKVEGNMEVTDNSNQLSTSLNTVDLKEGNETRDELGLPVGESGGTSDDDEAAIEVDENEDMMTNSGEDVGVLVGETNCGNGNNIDSEYVSMQREQSN